ncbi:MAG: DNA adenine methylase [Burkholderiales bacterium]|nr:DNA adenine methylase [Burkholderiales bacterium]
MTFRYIGSKARITGALSAFIGAPGKSDGRFVDAFCGTGAVAEAAARLGWPVLLNDSLKSAVTMAAARLLARTSVPFSRLGGYQNAINALNTLAPIEGFMWREYSPASGRRGAFERRYFTEHNAGLLDAMRAQLARWQNGGDVSQAEATLLIGDLLSAANRVANIAGTYGCFLAKWQPQSQGAVTLVPRELFPTEVAVETTNSDVFSLAVAERDLVYLDPPYTKRQYASYYHVLETLTEGDEPRVSGVSGLRPWKEKSSPFCYKRRALAALVELIGNMPAKKVLLSYSDEGHVPIEPLVDGLSRFGKVELVELASVGRYRPNKVASAARSEVSEHLIVVHRVVQTAKVRAAA